MLRQHVAESVLPCGAHYQVRKPEGQDRFLEEQATLDQSEEERRMFKA